MFLILTRVIAINFESEIKKKNENIGTVQRKNICTTSTSKSKTSLAKQISYTTTTTLFDGYCHWNCWLFSSPWLTSLRNRKSEDRRRDYMNSHSRRSFVTPCLALQTTEDWARKSWTNEIVQSFYFRPITTKEHVHNFSIQSDSYRLSVVTDFHYIFFVS